MIRPLCQLTACLALCLPGTLWAVESCPNSGITTAEVVAQFIDRNQATAKALAGYSSTRRYHLEFHGVKSLTADLVASASYRAPDRKEFRVESADGSELLQKRILRKLLESEVEASRPENRQQIAWNPANYDFRLLGCENVAGHGSYLLGVIPRHKNKFLMKGTIDLNRQDFALTRITAEPAVNPSWWTVRNEIEQTYAKTGDFWLPSRNTTVTKVRLFGQAFLTIDYGEYRLIETTPPPAPVRDSVIPLPNAITGARLIPQSLFPVRQEK